MNNRTNNSHLVPVLSRSKRITLSFLIGIWLASLVIFIHWWSQPEHIVNWYSFLINTTLLVWINVFPGYFFFFILKMRKVNPSISLPANWRVAMITTRAPSEPFVVVKTTLLAMLRQGYPHDTWLADEAPTEEISTWCDQHNVKLITRQGIAAYHRNSWPRRTKCKEGNLTYFYDTVGYKNYDFVVQMDADHIPRASYLEEMLKPFTDEKVGYVSAPSICDTNARTSWTARGRMYSEAMMHGPLQAGYTNGFAPLCIGSHYAVRTAALKQIGGLGPELAEDHSTTLMMASSGWKGVHALTAIARGEGPPSAADCIIQEFQWSRSLMILLLTELPKHWKKLTLRLKLSFLFSELWYPVFSMMFLIGMMLPIVAVITGKPWMTLSFTEFLLYSIPVSLSVMAIVYFLKFNKLLRPHYSPVISWETVLFQAFRWPWALYGSIMGVMAVVRKSTPTFRVTPKGSNESTALSWKILYPFIAVVVVSALPGILIQKDSEAVGYHFFLVFTVLLYLILIFSILVLDQYERRK